VEKQLTLLLRSTKQQFYFVFNLVFKAIMITVMMTGSAKARLRTNILCRNMTAISTYRPPLTFSRWSSFVLVLVAQIFSLRVHGSLDFPVAENNNGSNQNVSPRHAEDPIQNQYGQQKSSATSSTHPEASPQQFVPVMKPEHVALSLRLTCERNRRLPEGSLLGVRPQPKIAARHPESHQIPPAQPQALEEPMTLFHAEERQFETDTKKDPKKVLPGAEQWGPNLQDFVNTLVSDVLQLSEDESSIVLSLAMIYLDRASSVETLRSHGVPPCPFASFRTVHRLFMTSILTAAQVVEGKSIEEYFDKLNDLLGVSSKEILEMLTWMKYALGDSGHYVGFGEMQKFKHLWERLFVSTPKSNPFHGRSHPSMENARIRNSPAGVFYSYDTLRQSTSASSPSSSITNSGGGGSYQAAEFERSAKPAFVHSHYLR